MRLLPVLLITVFLNGCSTVGDFLGDEPYESPAAELTEFEIEFTPTVIWKTNVGEGAKNNYSDLNVVVDNDSIFTVDYEGQVTRLSTTSGSKAWQKELDIPVFSGVGSNNSLIFVGSQEGQVFALNKADGSVVWQKSVSSEVLAAPQATPSVVVIRTSDGRLSGLSTENGAQLWTYQRAVPLLSLRGAGVPVITGDKVIAGYASGKLVALSIEDGKVVWEKNVTIPRGRTELERISDVDAAPVIKDGLVYAVSFQGKVAALSVNTGDVFWSRDMSSKAGLDVAVGDSVYITDESSYVWAVQDGTGDALWRQTRLLRRNVSAPKVVGDTVLVGDFEGYLHWISRTDGRFVSRLKISDGAVVSQPILHNDVIYVITNDGTLAAIQAQ
jgi:outer membrane protein assembly factor BamB